jgi:hypothetical protein
MSLLLICYNITTVMAIVMPEAKKAGARNEKSQRALA